MTYLAFSRQVLRGMALEAQNNHADARALWLQLIPLAQAAVPAAAARPGGRR